jgi:16S rRNA (guanine(966)-N(2))-methyltransferase RsmD
MWCVPPASPFEKAMRTQLRIVAGSLKGRRITCTVTPALRPMPDRVRESLFNILNPVIANRPFFDLFAGTGAVGLEALSRGAAPVEFIESDGRVAAEIGNHLQLWGMASATKIRRADVYRWAERWQPPGEAVVVFLGPPYPDYERRLDDLMATIGILEAKIAVGSVLVLQSEKSFDARALPEPEAWDHRLYGRTQLSFWTKEAKNDFRT